jgi:uncharacterized paraquat-inducible protein A
MSIKTIDTDNQEQLAARLESAKLIEANAEKYKICEGCTSIVAKETILCPLCNAYRYDSLPSNVIARAYELAATIRTSLSAEDFDEEDEE